MRTETVTRLRGAGELELQTLCPAEPIKLGEPGQQPQGVVLTGWRLYLEETADVTARDRVRVRGLEYSVLGPPEDWLGGGRVVDSADIWTATCTVRHPGGERGAFDTSAGTYPMVPFDPHYSGDCWIYPLSTRGDQLQESAEEILTELGYLVAVDLDTSLETAVGDLVTIGAGTHGDPALVGRTLQVRTFSRGPLTWQRNLICTDFLAPEAIA